MCCVNVRLPWARAWPARQRNTADEAKVAGDAALGQHSVAHHLRLSHAKGAAVSTPGAFGFAFPVDFQATGAWAGNPWRNPLNLLPTAEGLQSSSRAIREAIGRTLYRAW